MPRCRASKGLSRSPSRPCGPACMPPLIGSAAAAAAAGVGLPLRLISALPSADGGRGCVASNRLKSTPSLPDRLQGKPGLDVGGRRAWREAPLQVSAGSAPPALAPSAHGCTSQRAASSPALDAGIERVLPADVRRQVRVPRLRGTGLSTGGSLHACWARQPGCNTCCPCGLSCRSCAAALPATAAAAAATAARPRSRRQQAGALRGGGGAPPWRGRCSRPRRPAAQ